MLIIESEELTVRMTDRRLGVGPADAEAARHESPFLKS
jgi:hypothetical protein